MAASVYALLLTSTAHDCAGRRRVWQSVLAKSNINAIYSGLVVMRMTIFVVITSATRLLFDSKISIIRAVNNALLTARDTI